MKIFITCHLYNIKYSTKFARHRNTSTPIQEVNWLSVRVLLPFFFFFHFAFCLYFFFHFADQRQVVRPRLWPTLCGLGCRLLCYGLCCGPLSCGMGCCCDMGLWPTHCQVLAPTTGWAGIHSLLGFGSCCGLCFYPLRVRLKPAMETQMCWNSNISITS